VLLAVFLALGAAWIFIEYGIPALAKRAAFALPQSVNTALGRDGLEAMDRVLLSPTELAEERQARLRSLFDEVAAAVPDVPGLQLELRKSTRLGPNALALPSGIIVVTDELVRLAENQNELISILAHEIGHVKQHHALRTLLQNSTAVLVVASVTGDLTSISALAAAMPTILLEAKYSRAFETEADLFALEYMNEHNIPPHYFADILTRIEEETKARPGTHYYLSSHPATRERIKMFTEAD
jgi:Zn-dependent protease with chaperone function